MFTSLHVFIKLPLTCIGKESINIHVINFRKLFRRTFVQNFTLFPLQERILQLLRHTLSWCLFTLLIALDDELSRELCRSLINPFEDLRLFLCQFAFKRTLQPHFIVLSSENFPRVCIRNTGSSGHHSSNLVDHAIRLFLRRTQSESLWYGHLLIYTRQLHFHILSRQRRA